MIRRISDVPLSGDPASRFLPWTVALLVFLATLALASGIFLQSAGETWRQNLSGTLTVQIPVADGGDRKSRMNAATELLRATPGVIGVRPIPDAEIAALLEPWLGNQVLGLELPMPDMIDVTVEPGAQIDIASLSTRLDQVAAGAAVDDHAVWLRRLTEFAAVAENLSYVVMIVILISAVATVIFTTRTGLAIHNEIVEVLHLIGAQDSYVARQFQAHTLGLAVFGAVIGFAVAATVIWAAQTYGDGLSGGLLPEIILGPEQWALLAALPVAAILLVVLTVGITVRHVLGKMM